MLVKITGRHMEITDAMRSYVEKKIAKLQKYSTKISETEVTIEKEALKHKVEIICKVDNVQPLVVNHTDEDMYTGIDAGIDKIERRLTRHKEKSRSRRGRIGTAEASAEVFENHLEDDQKKAQENLD